MPHMNLIGHKYGQLVVIALAYKKKSSTFWKCKCKCGNYTTVSIGALRRSKGNTTKCSECHTNRSGIKVGDVFGKLTIISKSTKKSKCRHIIWNCICECGNPNQVQSGNLKGGKVKSCGCNRVSLSNKKQKKKRTRTYWPNRRIENRKTINFNYAINRGWNKARKRKSKHIISVMPERIKWKGMINKHGMECLSSVTKKKHHLKVKCKCGEIFTIQKGNFTTQKSCGCSKKFEDLTGKRFGKLTVVKFSHIERVKNWYNYYWECVCDDGNIHIASRSSLKRGRVKSCGCLHSEAVKYGSKIRKDIKIRNRQQAELGNLLNVNWEESKRIIEDAEQRREYV